MKPVAGTRNVANSRYLAQTEIQKFQGGNRVYGVLTAI
jgi:hypothetical protein